MDLTVFLEINLIIVYYNNMLVCVQQMFYFPFKNKFPLMKAVRQVKCLENEKRVFDKTFASEYLS
jgi:hypothetical protein